MMKKSVRLIWFLSLILLVCTLMFTACNVGNDVQTPSGTTDETTTGAEDETTAGKEDQTTTGKKDETTGGEPPVHEHAFVDWKTTKEATCTAQGEAERACACGET